MVKKILAGIFIVATLLGGIFLYIKIIGTGKTEASNIVSPLANEFEKVENAVKKLGDSSIFKGKDVINILLIGTDTSETRRASGQSGFNTDVLILVSVNTKTKRVLFTSVPRDLWINGNKINALYILYGEETLVDAFEKITGMEVDGTVRIDFDGFKWLVNSMGGVPVTVKTTFTDESFPNNTDTGANPVTFTAGYEKMDGERALSFARSRKGNNGEGSDLMRAKRQHIILEGLPEAISQPESIFWPFDAPKFFEFITQHMETTLTLEDVYYLWDFYANRSEYTADSFVVGDDYVYHPGMYPESEYHAWVFIPRDSTFGQLQLDIKAKLDGTFAEENKESEVAGDSTSATEPNVNPISSSTKETIEEITE